MAPDGSITLAEGNTIPPPIKRCPSAVRWSFTYNNYDLELLNGSIIPFFKQQCKVYIVGLEVGESGTPHVQGYVEFITKRRAPEFVGKICNKIHWELSKGNRTDNIKYCSKDNNVLSSFNCSIPKPLKIINELRNWQQNILDICLTEPDDRTINWYFDKCGNIGKTSFIKYMVYHHNALFCNGGKYSDIMNLVFNQDMDNCNIVLFDIPRANKGNISYSSLESIKNGMVCNTKYETGTKLFNSPHVFIFANFPPENYNDLSIDRWNIKQFVNDNFIDFEIFDDDYE